MKTHENPSSGSRGVPSDGRTDRHDEANNRFSQFCEKRLKCYIKLNTKQTTITLQDTERQTDRERERYDKNGAINR